MILTNVTISTEYEYGDDDKYIYYLQFKIPIPNGFAVYHLPCDEEFKTSIEQAIHLK